MNDDENGWDQLHFHHDEYNHYRYDCQTELERWYLFLSSKYEELPDWMNQ